MNAAVETNNEPLAVGPTLASAAVLPSSNEDAHAALLPAAHALARRFELPTASQLDTPAQQRRWRALKIGNLRLLVPHDCGGEILEEPLVAPLPRTPAWCRGLINLRGRLIPAFDLHEALGVAHLRAQHSHWLALGTSEDTLAFTVDALPNALVATQITRVHDDILPTALRTFVGDAFSVAGELWLEFRHIAFFRALAGTPRSRA